MKKKIYLFIVGFIVVIALSIYFIAINESKNNNQNKIEINLNSKKIICTIKGAVVENKEVLVNKGTTIREALTKVELSIDADISKLNLDKSLLKDTTIFVPYLKGTSNKLSWDQIENITILIQHGISKNLAQKIIDFKQEFQGVPTWKDIDQIEGVGIKTLEKLKTIIILD